MPSYLFVYGTLMRKLPPNEWSEFLQKNAQYIGEGKTKGKLYLVADYPGLVLQGDSDVFGEIYEITNSEKLFHFLDQYEDFRPDDLDNSLYKRTPTKVVLLSEEKRIETITYVYNQDVSGLTQILNGRFETLIK